MTPLILRFCAQFGEGVIRLTKLKLPGTLNAKMIYMLLLSILCSGAVFALIAGIGKYCVDNIYMSSANVSARNAELYTAFNRYVKNNSLSSDDSEGIQKCRG